MKTITRQNPALTVSPCVLGSVCVPWKEEAIFLEPVFRRQVRDLRKAGYESLYVFGTAGEGYGVTHAQFRRIGEVFFDETRDLPGLRQLGVIGMSTAQVRERIETGIEMGFEWFQISLPCWGTVNDCEMDRFFDDVLAPYPQVRFLHYNNIRSGRKLTGAEYARLRLRHGNLAASKSGGHTPGSLWDLLHHAPDMTHFLTEPSFVLASLLGFQCGLLASVTALHPPRSLALFRAGTVGDIEALRRYNDECHRILEEIVSTVSAQGGHIDGAFDKLFSRALDPEFPLRLLSPYGCVDEACHAAFMRWVEKELPEWTPTERRRNGSLEDGTRI